MKRTRDLPSRVRNSLKVEQFRILRLRLPILYAVFFINTGVLIFSVYGTVPAKELLLIPAVFGSVVAVRFFILLYRGDALPSAEVANRYLLSATFFSAIVSLGMGIWGFMLLRSEAGEHLSVPMFIGFGTIACAYCLASLPRAAFATIVFAITPVIFGQLTSSVRLEIAAGLYLLLIFLLMLRLIAHQYEYLLEKVISHSQLKTLAYTDSLTGLPNRRAFIECLDETMASQDSSQHVAVAMIDLDGFKAINDTYGHSTGDEVLTVAARRLEAACSGCKMIARMGGDEFAILFVETENCAMIPDIGRDLVAEMSRPFDVSDFHLRLAISMGIAACETGEDSAIKAMSRADIALYQAKQSGGNGLQLFESEMGMRLRRRVMIGQSLLDTDPGPQIEVLYQPIFDARTKQVTTFEALARWKHPTLGQIDPLEFIGVAEQTGTITAISEQIFSTAIREAAGWPEHIGLSINLSGIDLCRQSMPLSILLICHRHNFDPKRLEVEITETAVLSDFDVARDQINVLRKSGIKVTLDDFGSGFASISYLKEIAFDRVKVDGELIAPIIQSPQARRLVQGILQLCAAINVPTTAEKVESKAQLSVLVGLGCDRLQGYLLSRPVSAQAALEFVDIERQAA